VIGEIKDTIGKSAKERMVLGIDLTDEFSQISYCPFSQEEPETLSMILGEEKMCIPTALAKRYGENIWTFGEEAQELEQKNEGFLITSLITLAREGELIEVETRDYDPVDLLALFLKKCISKLALVAPIEKVSSIVITVEEPDAQMIQILSKVIATLRIKPEKVFFQSHAESAYHYILHQPKELWNHDVLICNLKGNGLEVMMFQKNNQTTPVVMLMKSQTYPRFLPETFATDKKEDGRKSRKDQELYQILYVHCEGHYISSIYLLGDGFDGGWYQDSLKYMCRNRRVFRGNNLFSKGACYGAKEKIENTELESKHVFLGKDKLKSNLGMRVVREGRESYMALLDAGKNWYDSVKECDLILDREDTINIIVTPLDGKNPKTIPIYLRGLPVRPPRATRIHIEIRMLSETRLAVNVTDLGFGEFFAASGMQWSSEVEID